MTPDREPVTQVFADRLGLVRDPFGEPSADFFFVGGQRRFLVQQAVHALYFAGGLVLLSGAEGAGKTRVLDEICRELGELVDVCRLEASVLMDASAIRARCAEALGLSIDVSSDESLLAALDQLAPEDGDALPVLLAIDDAHQLAAQVLVACYQLVQASGGRLRLLLVGAPELLIAWNQTGAHDADQLDVLPLDAQETLDYVATTLQAAGYRGENPLDEAAQDELYRKSRGNIGAIHALAPDLLNRAVSGEAVPAAARRLPLPHLAIAVGLVVVVGVLLVFFRGSGDESAAAPESAATGDGRQSLPLTLPPAAEAPASAPAPAEPPVPVAPAAPAAAPEVPAAQPVERTPAPAPVQTPAPAHPAPAPVPVAKPAPAPKPVVKQEAPAVKPVNTAAVNGNGLAAMPKDQFVVQLMAATSKAKLSDFLARSARGVKVYTYETRRDGKPWFVAVAGPYASKAAARAAIGELPKALRDQNPWLRPVASVQSDLKKQ